MRLLPGLRFRLPLIVLAAGALFVAFDTWIEIRLATGEARRTVLAHAAGMAERGAVHLGGEERTEPHHRYRYLGELRNEGPAVLLVGLLDRAGRLADAEPRARVGAPLESLFARAAVRDSLAAGPGVPAARLYADDRAVAASAEFATPAGPRRFVCVLDVRPRLAAITRRIREQSLPGAALGVAIVVLLAWLLERWLHEPSQRLQSAAARFAGGDLGARSGLRGDDEISRAGEAFDRMADDVERTERALIRARIQFEHVLASLPVGVSVVSRADGRILFANSRLREMLGAGDCDLESLERLLARLEVSLPDGTPVAPGDLATPRALRTGRPATCTDRVLARPDGERIPFVSNAVPLSLAGGEEFDAVVTVTHDRRELLRLSEELHLWKHRYERVVAATAQVVYEWDLVADMFTSSANREQVVGYRPAGRDGSIASWRARLHPDDAGRAIAALDRCLATGEPYDVEYRLRHGDGHWVTLHDRGFFDLGTDGRPVRMYGTMSDVTRQRELEARLLQAQKMEMLGTLAGGVAHDFNNQLTGVIGHLDLLHDTLPAGDASLEHLRIARLAAERCADLTRGLLAFGRRLESRPRPTSLNTLGDETAKLLRRALPVTVRLDTEFDPALPDAHVDPGQVQQVLLNLCLNARDAMPAGGRIRVATRPAAVPGFVQLEVRDTGPGIAPEVMPRIFEPFFTTKPVGKGTGLGLAMVYGIVSEHGGRIEVDSRPGEGACFRVLLPVARAPRAAEPAAVPRPHPRPGRGECVLVVDDEPVVRSLARRALEAAGYRVLDAGGADEAEAVLAAHAHSVRAVLLDVMMPGRTGIEALPALRRIAPGLRVVLTSGYSQIPAPPADPDVSFLPKPFTPAGLAEAVQAAVAGSPVAQS